MRVQQHTELEEVANYPAPRMRSEGVKLITLGLIDI